MWGALLVVMGAILVAYTWKLSRLAKLPPAPPVLGQVSSFSLTNQAGQVVTLDQLLGKVWIADIIFTRCPGPCAQMTRSMAELQTLVAGLADVRLVSLTTDPEFDTPPVLADYARRAGARSEIWQFLTGTPAELRKLAVNGLRLTAIEKDSAQQESANDLFIHSTVCVVVDRKGRLRASFETTGPDVRWSEMKERIAAVVAQLAVEP